MFTISSARSLSATALLLSGWALLSNAAAADETPPSTEPTEQSWGAPPIEEDWRPKQAKGPLFSYGAGYGALSAAGLYSSSASGGLFLPSDNPEQETLRSSTERLRSGISQKFAGGFVFQFTPDLAIAALLKPSFIIFPADAQGVHGAQWSVASSAEFQFWKRRVSVGIGGGVASAVFHLQGDRSEKLTNWGLLLEGHAALRFFEKGPHVLGLQLSLGTYAWYLDPWSVMGTAGLAYEWDGSRK